MKKSFRATATLLLTILLLAGCITPMGMSPSNVPLHNKAITENLGKTEGSHTQWILFGLPIPLHISLNKPDVDMAIAEALAAKKGDALINVRWYTKYYHFLLFSTSTLVIEGEAVKLTENTPDK